MDRYTPSVAGACWNTTTVPGALGLSNAFLGRIRTTDSDGPQPSGCFNAQAMPVGKSLLVFENKASVCRTLGAA